MMKTRCARTAMAVAASSLLALTASPGPTIEAQTITDSLVVEVLKNRAWANATALTDAPYWLGKVQAAIWNDSKDCQVVKLTAQDIFDGSADEWLYMADDTTGTKYGEHVVLWSTATPPKDLGHAIVFDRSRNVVPEDMWETIQHEAYHHGLSDNQVGAVLAELCAPFPLDEEDEEEPDPSPGGGGLDDPEDDEDDEDEDDDDEDDDDEEDDEEDDEDTSSATVGEVIVPCPGDGTNAGTGFCKGTKSTGFTILCTKELVGKVPGCRGPKPKSGGG